MATIGELRERVREQWVTYDAFYQVALQAGE